MYQYPSREELVGFFARHFISLGWFDKTPGERSTENSGRGHYENVSGFVISIRDNWFWITAGHVIERIRIAKEKGQLLGDWHLDDSDALGARFNIPIPFDFDDAFKLFFYDDTLGMDYALIYLSPYYRNLLIRNNIKPLNEQAWRIGIPEDFDFYLLIGLPDELVRLPMNTEVIMKGCVLIPIQRIYEPPSGVLTALPRFYGKIPDKVANSEYVIEDISGMSGGPIFGFKKDSEDQLRYWVVALQSGWFKSERIITACPVQDFADWIDSELEKITTKLDG